jgi:DNA polymerase I-like protein with 3'-5' exonuclease and polymerase domains
MLTDAVVVDFETAPITDNTSWHPPKPVGVAIRWADGKAEYLAWGHPGADNNCTYDEARRALVMAWRSPIIFHHGKFDIAVAIEHFNLPWPVRWHDTMFMLFLHNPDAINFQLKDASQRYLSLPPVQQDAVHDWIMANVPGATKKNAGAHIAKAPVSLVGPYAIGDVERTYALATLLWPHVVLAMPEAYQRELRLTPHLYAAERRGIRVNRPLLYAWAEELTAAVDRCDELLRARLNTPGLNLDSNDDLVVALDVAGVMTHWENAKGEVIGAGSEPEVNPFVGSDLVAVSPQRRSTSKGALQRGCKDKELVAELSYRNAAATMLRTFIRPWYDLSATDGRLHTTWHQTRGQEKNGTRTGRIASSDPNLANVPTPNEDKPPFGLPFLPSLRSALLPEEGEVWVSADYSQQELRIAAHFEDDAMQSAYQANPSIDLHSMVMNLIMERTGIKVDRHTAKTVAFLKLYGGGVGKLASTLGCPEYEAYAIIKAYEKALPGLLAMINAVRDKARMQGWVRSIGGRRIPLEPSKLVGGVYRTFDYKMGNKLIQGSAADQCKESIAQYCEAGGSATFLCQCYDEINISVPPGDVPYAVEKLRTTMINAIPIDVPMLCDVEVGPSWGELKAYE